MTTLLLLLSLSLFQPARTQASGWRVVETVGHDWRHAGERYTFLVEKPPNNTASGDPTRLRIRVPGKPEFVLLDEGGINQIGGELANKRLAAKNLLRSPYLYLSPDLKSPQGLPMLIVFGWAHAGSPGSIHVLALDADGYPSEVFAAESLVLADLADVDGDGRREIVGKNYDSEGLVECLSTYNPYAVYRLPPSGAGKAKYSLALSRAYNLKHYYGWAGATYREDVFVDRCARRGRPRLISAKRAHRIYN
ncbi:MAG TPA: hypothetical protein VF538_08225 [Pyrinomonadaceae bacterium]|jgi:hypothetical protein